MKKLNRYQTLGLVWLVAGLALFGFLVYRTGVGTIVSNIELFGAPFSIPQFVIVTLIVISQALFNHFGIRVTTMLTDFSGYLIFIVAIILTLAVLGRVYR